MFFVYWLYRTWRRRRADKKKSKAAARSLIAERDALLAGVPETDVPDERRDTTTPVAVEEPVRHADGRRDAGNDGGTRDSTALTGHDDETISVRRLLVMLETLTNKMEYLEDRFKTRMESMERRVGRLSDSQYALMPNSNMMIRVTALEARKRRNDRRLNDLSGKMSACDQRLFDVETDYNYTKYSHRELVEMHDVLSRRLENLGAALNIDVNPGAHRRLGRSISDDEMQMNQISYGD